MRTFKPKTNNKKNKNSLGSHFTGSYKKKKEKSGRPKLTLHSTISYLIPNSNKKNH